MLVAVDCRINNLGFLPLIDTSLTGNLGLSSQSNLLDYLSPHVDMFSGDRHGIKSLVKALLQPLRAALASKLATSLQV